MKIDAGRRARDVQHRNAGTCGGVLVPPKLGTCTRRMGSPLDWGPTVSAGCCLLRPPSPPETSSPAGRSPPPPPAIPIPCPGFLSPWALVWHTCSLDLAFPASRANLHIVPMSPGKFAAAGLANSGHLDREDPRKKQVDLDVLLLPPLGISANNQGLHTPVTFESRYPAFLAIPPKYPQHHQGKKKSLPAAGPINLHTILTLSLPQPPATPWFSPLIPTEQPCF